MPFIKTLTVLLSSVLAVAGSLSTFFLHKMVYYKCVLSSRTDHLQGNSGGHGYSSCMITSQARLGVIN